MEMNQSSPQQTSSQLTRSLSYPAQPLKTPKPKELLARRCSIKQNAPLKSYIYSRVRREQDFFSFREILQIICDHLKDEGTLEDSSNRDKIICPPSLSKALLRRTVRKTEIIDVAAPQIDFLPNLPDDIKKWDNSKICCSEWRFTHDSTLKTYLETKTSDLKEINTGYKILTTLRTIINDKGLYDKRNPLIIVCDSDLEEALNSKACHMTELRDIVLTQLILVKERTEPSIEDISSVGPQENGEDGNHQPITTCDTTDSTTSQTSGKVIFAHKSTDMAASSLQTCSAQSGSFLLTGPQSIVPAGKPLLDQTSSVAAPKSAQKYDFLAESQPSTSSSSYQRPASHSGQAPKQLPNTCLVQTDPLVLSPVPSSSSSSSSSQPDVQPEDDIYSDEKSRFRMKDNLWDILNNFKPFDPSQTEYPLREISNTLVGYLLSRKERLFDPRNISVAIIKDDPLGEVLCVDAFHRSQTRELLIKQLIYVEPPQGSQAPSESASPQVLNRLPTFPILTKSASMPARSKAESLADLLAASTRKRNASGDINDTLLKRNRSEADPVSLLVAASESAKSNTTEDESGLDTEFEVEYEIDSAEETVVRPPQAFGGGSEGGSSSEDSDIEVNVVVQQVEVKEEEKENWADSEGEVTNNKNVEETKDKPRMTKLDLLTCYRCKDLRQPHAKYCSRCWEERRSWLPERPKRLKSRRKRDNDREQMSARSKESQSDCTTPDTDIGEIEKDSCPEVVTSSLDSLPCTQQIVESSQELLEDPVQAPSCESTESAQETLESVAESTQEIAESMKEASESTQEVAESFQETCESTTGSDKSVAVSRGCGPDYDGASLQKRKEEAKVSDGRAAVRSLQPETNKLARSFSADASTNTESGSASSRLCIYCYLRPKDTSLIHGRLGHQVSCYECAKKHWKRNGQCPVCKRRIEKIIKIIVA